MTVYKRKYCSYEQYIRHQARKSKKICISKAKFKENIHSFCKRFDKFIKYFSGQDILCLGARWGEEVLALRSLGFTKTIGIDLNPGKFGKKYGHVIKGDFNNIFFENETFDTIYTNAIDHAWNIALLFKEVNRVLRKNGIFILEVSHIVGETQKTRKLLVSGGNKYEVTVFDSIEDICKYSQDFEMVNTFRGLVQNIIVVFRKK